MTPGTWDTTIRQGSTWRRRLSLPDTWDLDGFTARMDIVSSRTGTAALQLDTTAGGITIDAETGTIDIVITSQQSAALQDVKHNYDLELVSALDPRSATAEAQAILTGIITVERQWTLP